MPLRPRQKSSAMRCRPRPLRRLGFVSPNWISGSFRQNAEFVMAGLVPAIHAFLRAKQGVDARDKRGHDGGKLCAQTSASLFPSPCILLSRAGALPRGASRRAVVPNCRFRTLRNPKRGKRSAEIRGRGSPHPLARLTVGPVPPAGGNCRSITRTGAPLGAPPRRFP